MLPTAVLLVLAILSTALVLFIGGWVRMDLVALLVLAALALTGLVTPEEALAGFSSAAVVTVWAMFILSAGLSRTGVANVLGRPLVRFARKSEAVLVLALMFSAALLSALINTVTVAAILLPTTLELARRSGRPPSRLLLPLAMGCLLGGPFTSISTPPNILVTDALRAAGLTPFRLFDFTPITAALVAAGVLFVVLLGRRLLPARAPKGAGAAGEELERSYALKEHLFSTLIAPKSPLVGQTLARSRLGSALHLTVIAILRDGRLELGPDPDEVFRGGDSLILHGRPDHLERLHGHEHLRVESREGAEEAVARRLRIAEGRLDDASPLAGSTLEESGLRRDRRVHVLAVRRGGVVLERDLPRLKLQAGDFLLLEGEMESLEGLARDGLVEELTPIDAEEVAERYQADTRLLPVRVPEGSILTDRNLAESRLGNAFGLTVVAIVRGDDLLAMPSPDETVCSQDLLLLRGSPDDFAVMEGLQDLEISRQTAAQLAELESQQVGATEVLLSPRTGLAGTSLAEMRFRDRYGLTVLALWREGKPYRTGLRDMRLRFGDALLVYGRRRNLEALARDPDFLVLDESAAQAPRLEKAPTAAGIMLAVLAAAMIGWTPIAIAALTGAALMVLGRCLTMEEAYRAIEWKVIFLIAGMLPLGVALDHSGAARLAAEGLIFALGGFEPRWIVAALFVVTVLATQVVPTAALVVLMAPIALTAAQTLGISPHLLMMTVAISASSSFASPVSHPAHLLVMGPGGYRFMDYVKLGVPLTAISFLVTLLLLPLLFPP
jgi:di/tricarboxylate transporter